MTWLITGGAGYIGGHVLRELLHTGRDAVVLDDLSTGDPDRLPAGVTLTHGTVLDTGLVTAILRAHHVDGVIHLAGRKSVADSLTSPLDYYRHNVLGMHSLLTAVVRAGTPNVLFSSSAAVYGNPATATVSERSPTNPLSPYGRTKLVCEQLLRDTAAAHGLNWVALRYFNVGGAASTRLADRGTDNLIPRVLAAVTAGRAPRVFGLDHPTPDGSCVRDYIHVTDLAAAHTHVVHHLERTRLTETYNVGRGHGASVLQVIHAVHRATGRPIRWQPAPARAGDPPTVIADPTKIHTELHWQATRNLDDIIESAWHAWKTTAEVA